jgi:hypothetical protein
LASSRYRALGADDVIPSILTTISLPQGASIVKSWFTIAPRNNGFYYAKVPQSNFVWKMVKNQAEWPYSNLSVTPLPTWHVLMKLHDRAKAYIVRVVAKPMVKNAPVQHSTLTIPAIKKGVSISQ